VKNLLLSFWTEQAGVTAIEYALIATLMFVVAISAITGAGTSLNALWLAIASNLPGN
jgi:pilus assembly protein Flp/PilA